MSNCFGFFEPATTSFENFNGAMLTAGTPESGGDASVSGQGGDTLNLHAPSGETGLKVTGHGPGVGANDIKRLLNEFKGLYEQRLKYLELDTSVTREELAQKKVDFLQSYVKDLTDQNQVLVQTIEDLQRGAGHKVSNMAMKLHTLGLFEDDLRTLLLDDLAGPVVHIPHSSGSLVHIESETEHLKVQLQTKDMVISDLERELSESLQQNQKTATQVLESGERLAHLQSELSCLQRIHEDSTREIAEKDICITKLRANVQLLQQEAADARAQLSKLTARTKELEEELKRKEEEWRRYEKDQTVKEERDREEAEERRRQEQRKREESMRREEEWKRSIEEDRKACTQAVKKWSEKAAVLNSELEVSRKQVERQSRQLSEFRQKEETLLCEAEAKMVRLKDELGAFFEARMEEKEAKVGRLTKELNGLRQKVKEKEDDVKHMDQEVVGLRATQDSLKTTLSLKEKHAQQLVQYNTELKEGLAILQSKLQTSERMLNDMSGTLDQTRTSLSTDRLQKQKIQDQLQHANKEVERLQLELTQVRRATEKKIQKRESKMRALLKELTESKTLHSNCEEELLRREKAAEKLREERDELRAKMEDQSRECVRLSQTKERLEADLALSHEKLHTSHLEVRSRDQLILQLRAEMKTAEQKHQETQKKVMALEEEVRHLNHKVRAHQEEARRLTEKVRDIERLKDQKEEEEQQLHDQFRISRQQVKTSGEKLKKQEAELEVLHQQLKGAEAELKETSLQTREHKETVAIFKQKYTAAMEKVHKVQRQVELLEEELRYSQQQLRERESATHSVKDELAELDKRYQEKVAQWESSREALDQLTDELQVNQNLLRESERKVDHFRGLMGSLQEQMDTLKQQKLTVECDLQLYRQSHSHSDEEYFSILKLRQQLQKRCTEQVERLAECERAILQMKSDLERQNKEKAALKQSLAASNHSHLTTRKHLEQEVTRLRKEVTRLELELADTQKVQVALLRQSEEELEEARRESAIRSREVDAERGEVQRLRKELQTEEEKVESAFRENRSLSAYVKQLSQEMEKLCSKHQVAVEELAARAEEARRMEGCLSEGKLAEEKIRSMAVRMEKEVTELRKSLQHAVDQKVKAEREKQDAQEQVNTLRTELEGTRSDNANLRRESQLVMTKVNVWISEQKASNESLSAHLKAQNKVLLIVTEEKEHLLEANDTLKAEVERLKEAADEKERDTERYKAQIRDRGIRQDGKTAEEKGCVALNLSKIEDMRTRLQSNLEAIGMLNQQLNVLSRENKRLRRKLEEERSMRRQVERLLPPPPTSQPCSSIHLPLSLSGCPPPHPSLDPVTGGN